jgi:hypothetical protein
MIFVFGYVRTQKSELLVREFEQYKGIYCSLCRQLGCRYGVASRLTLSYDCTFYAMLLIAFNPECPGFQSGRCVVNPLKKCTYCTMGENELTSASALSVIMTYHKIKDDICDSHFLGKLRGYLMLPFAAHARKKAARDFPQMDSVVSAAMIQQKEAEESENPGIDFCAEPTAKMLQKVFQMAAGDDAEEEGARARILRQVGYYLGRWVYLIDAADDISKDIKSKNFNPFVIQYHLDTNSTQEDLDNARKEANQVLNLTLSQLIAAFNILEFHHFGPILENVIYKGLPQIQKEILFKKEKINVRSL